MIIHISLFPKSNIKKCILKISEVTECVKGVEATFEPENCSCPAECDYVSIETDVQQALWPNPKSAVSFPLPKNNTPIKFRRIFPNTIFPLI